MRAGRPTLSGSMGRNMKCKYRIFHILLLHYFFFRNILENDRQILKNYEIGKTLNFNHMQQEALLLALLETSKVQNGSSFDRLYNDLLSNDMGITLTCFSLLLGMINIQDKQFHLILKILSKSCTVMLQHNPFFAVIEFFESEKFFQQFINITKVIDELWMLRKEKPEHLQEWRKKHRQIFQFRSILLKFLGSVLTFRWVQDLKERAEKQRVRVWSMDGQ